MAESETTLSGPWAARLAIADLLSASRLRTIDDIRVAADAEWLWLRGTAMNAEILQALHHIGPTDIYSIAQDEHLIAVGDALPSHKLPPLSWTPIRNFYIPIAPPSLLCAAIGIRVSLRLTRSGSPREANVLLTPLAELANWTESAPEFRMRRLRYAATTSHALLIGTPLPPIPGTRYYEHNGICIPSGFELEPAIDASSLRVALNLSENDLALFDSNGWQHIPGDALVVVNRSSLRITLFQGAQR